MSNRDQIAIVGYAVRLPGASNVDGFWALLRDNRQSVSWITPDRFPSQSLYHPASETTGRSYTFAAGVIDDVWGFDAAAFGMSPREAEQVDPQQRHLLEVTHDALAHAGIPPSTLAGRDVGVYVGASSVDHIARLIADPSACDMYLMTGNTLSIMANRISYNLDIRGPSLTVDTACSSSLVALDLAAEAIRSGQVDTAIVGGVNLLLSPFSYIGFSRASMLSPTGRCRPFDAAADGYVRSEGAIVLVLRSLAAARTARNHVYATIVGSGVGQDGRTTGVSLPSTDSQRALLEKVYSDFAVDPSDLTFFEAHGTGTKVGDPIEANAIGKALAQRRSRPLPIGSVKSNIGHLEPASGLAGVVKSILALNSGLVPATLHQDQPNPNIDFDGLNIEVVGRNWRPPDRRGPALAGVNSFGFGGTNAHVILASGDTPISLAHRSDAAVTPLLISAHSAPALTDLASAYLKNWPSDKRAVGDYIAAAAYQRDALPHRTLIPGENADDIKHRLEQFSRGEVDPGVISGQALGADLPVAYLFSGNGSQWAGMGRDAWTSSPRFRDALSEIDACFAKVQTWSISQMLFAEDLEQRLKAATYAQPLLLALQAATVRVLEGFGLSPVATLGHSVGEIAAAWAAGALSLEQAIDIVIARSRHQEVARGSGTMAALMLSEREAKRFLERAGVVHVEVAAINSSRSVTVSGPTAEIEQLLQAASDQRISARRLDLEYPFHSALVDPVRAPLLRELDGLAPQEARRRLYSSVTGGEVDSATLVAQHWWLNVREPVRFESALAQMLKDGARLFVEIGPKPILGSHVRDMLRGAGVRGAVVETLGEASERAGGDCLERTVSRIVVAGGHVDTQRFFGSAPIVAHALPLYPWQHAQFKVKPTTEAFNVFGTLSHPLLGARPKADTAQWFSTLDATLFPWLADHKVGDVAVLPAAALVEIMLAAAREIHGAGPIELREFDILRPLTFEIGVTIDSWLRLSHESGRADYLTRPRGSPDWTLHAQGVLARSTASAKEANEPIDPTGTVIVPKTTVYATTRRLGFDYGPAFQRIRHAAFLSSTCMAVSLDPPAQKTMAEEIVDLTGLDAALHGLFASEDGGITYLSVVRMMPTRFGRVRVFKSGATAARAVTWTMRRTASSTLVDIDLFDADGAVILAAEGVRLTEAPADAAADFRTLSYRLEPWLLERPGVPSTVRYSPDVPAVPAAGIEPGALSDARLLLEAGCLRSAWTALQARTDASSIDDPDRPSAPEWLAYLRSAIVWQLEQHGLIANDGADAQPAPSCDLPAVTSVIGSLMAGHPTMGLETAGLARIDSLLPRVMVGDPTIEHEFESTHWRQVDAAARQIAAVRAAAVAEVQAALAAGDRDRLITLLFIGAAQADLAVDLANRFPNLVVAVTDFATDRLEQASAMVGNDATRVRFIAWKDLESLGAGSIDVALAIDALSEATAAGYDLGGIVRLLRPLAPMIVGELAPSLFWDIVRTARPFWWKRSVDADLPISALLTAKEWIDELLAAGFATAQASPVLGHQDLGVLLRCSASSASVVVTETEVPVFLWDRDARKGTVAARLAHHLESRTEVVHVDSLPALPSNGRPSDAPAEAAITDAVWLVDASHQPPTPAGLTQELAAIARRCRELAHTPARLWLIVHFGDADPQLAPLQRPVWCALASAMRVAQNEYAGLEIRCLGLSGELSAAMLDRTADEILQPGEEREIFWADGRRTVFRLARGALPATPAAILGDDHSRLRLADRRRASRTTLDWVREPRPDPGPLDVEIEVAASALNFRDVMWNLRLLPEEALEDGHAGPGLGMECAGTITRLGKDVQGLALGDQVLAVAPNAFASHVIAPSFAVHQLPAGLTPQAGATIPVAFLTAYYSLIHLARLQTGETVLIHGGAGGVGLAALQIAKRQGARVICTAGTEAKRDLLRNLGADYVFNSRGLEFADEVLAHTDRKGVDVVLNSLAGEAMAHSVDCLKPFGRFVELGKRDYYANTQVGLRPFRRNLSYFGVDVDQLLREHSDLAQKLFGELMALFARRELVALPYRQFEGESVADAFWLMQHSGHIGKIVVTPARAESLAARLGGRFPVASTGSHLVIGGTSGFGLATAEWLASRGATTLVLASRSGKLSPAAARQVEALRARGIDVTVSVVDVADRAALAGLLRRTAARAPIKGIVHAAMVLSDGLIDGLGPDAIARAVQPKVAGALNLERLTRGMALDYLLFYSSATTVFGNPGQYNYVAANAFLEGLARRLQAEGRPACAVAWGAIKDAGFIARNIEADGQLKKRFGTNLIAAHEALDGLDWMFDPAGQPVTAVCTIAKVDWALARRELRATWAPTFGIIPSAGGPRASAAAGELIEKLLALPADEARGVLEEVIVEEIARVLRLPPKEVDRYRALADIGMDSLMMLELRTIVEEALQVELPMMSLASGISSADVARRILPLVIREQADDTVTGAVAALSSSHIGDEGETADPAQRRRAVGAVIERSRSLEDPL